MDGHRKFEGKNTFLMVSHLGYHERILFAETSVVKLYIYKKTKLKKTAAIKDTTKKKQM